MVFFKSQICLLALFTKIKFFPNLQCLEVLTTDLAVTDLILAAITDVLKSSTQSSITQCKSVWPFFYFLFSAINYIPVGFLCKIMTKHVHVLISPRKQ